MSSPSSSHLNVVRDQWPQVVQPVHFKGRHEQGTDMLPRKGLLKDRGIHMGIRLNLVSTSCGMKDHVAREVKSGVKLHVYCF